MRTGLIAYRDAELKACEKDDVWTVRLANLEARARYLDLALAQLLGSAPEAHRAAARLLAQLADVAEQQETAHPPPSPPRRPGRRGSHRNEGPASRAFRLGFRAVAFAVIASSTFVLTTWLTALR
jgi:hypothetical protein